MRIALDVLSVGLLLVLGFSFLRGAWRGPRQPIGAAPAGRFDSGKASYLLGLTLVLTSPWSIAFWLAAIGRPEMVQRGMAALLTVILGVFVAALGCWGALWSGIVLVLRRNGAGRAWNVGMKTLTGLLMLYFAAASIAR